MDVKEFVKKFKIEKSVDFTDTRVAIDFEDQAAAEKTADQILLDYIDYSIDPESNVCEIPLRKGKVSLTVKEPGLFDAIYSDESGQVTYKFENQTKAILAKNLQMREVGQLPIIEEQNPGEYEAKSEIELESKEEEESPAYIRVKMGDFELELRKSVVDFAKSYKNNKRLEVIKKAIRNTVTVEGKTDQQKAQNLLKSWESNKESFLQAIDAVLRNS